VLSAVRRLVPLPDVSRCSNMRVQTANSITSSARAQQPAMPVIGGFRQKAQ
jgi:hypothetical protein